MNNKYVENANMFKALSDPGRLEVLEILSEGEQCACKILEKLEIKQPTLSHHMKILSQSDLVKGRHEGKWIYYSINAIRFEKVALLLEDIAKNSKKKRIVCCSDEQC